MTTELSLGTFKPCKPDAKSLFLLLAVKVPRNPERFMVHTETIRHIECRALPPGAALPFWITGLGAERLRTPRP